MRLLWAEPFGHYLAQHEFTAADLNRLAALTETRFRWLEEHPLWTSRPTVMVMAGQNREALL